MSRRNTIQEERWRVQVLQGIEGKARVTHESVFGAIKGADDYYDTLHLPGCSKRFQHRPAGAQRFKTLKQEGMLTVGFVADGATSSTSLWLPVMEGIGRLHVVVGDFVAEYSHEMAQWQAAEEVTAVNTEKACIETVDGDGHRRWRACSPQLAIVRVKSRGLAS